MSKLLARTPETLVAMITSTTLSDFVCRTMGGRPSIFPVKHKQLANPMTLYLSYESPAMPFDPFYPDYPLRHEMPPSPYLLSPSSGCDDPA
ncbi:hypothetical protein PAPYR_4270 [Paratrimastix pyriformis]|uniref:Uncharacterized protein n=1 Tax=Paratrimastix pyriformis TaxID=342808 RepID=A0ABQ8UK12_9EUKA|nr:hypothetical protein PAPYR_4270 [Paratrimastix pyriformis]